MIKRINFTKKASLVLIIAFIFQACGFNFEENIQLNADYDITSVSSLGHVGSPLSVQLFENVPRYIPFSTDGGYYINDANAILNAEIVLVDKTNDHQIALRNILSRDIYTSTESIHENTKEYELQIRTPDGATYSAISLVPTKVEIAAIDYEELSRRTTSFGGTTNFPRRTNTTIQLSVNISFDDDVEEKNYYALLVEDNSSFSIRNDTLFRNFRPVEYNTNDPAFLNEEINVFGIVEENNVSVSSQPYFFSDLTFSTMRKTIKFNYSFTNTSFSEGENPDSAILRIVLFSVNEDYYKYITSIRRSKFSRDNPFAEPLPIYTNMSNEAQGLFTISHSDTLEIMLPE